MVNIVYTLRTSIEKVVVNMCVVKSSDNSDGRRPTWYTLPLNFVNS